MSESKFFPLQPYWLMILIYRFTTEEDKTWFEGAIRRTVKEQLGEDCLNELAEEPYFVDFLRDPPEPTGDEPDDAVLEAPKIYELVNSFSNVFFLLLSKHFHQLTASCNNQVCFFLLLFFFIYLFFYLLICILSFSG